MDIKCAWRRNERSNHSQPELKQKEPKVDAIIDGGYTQIQTLSCSPAKSTNNTVRLRLEKINSYNAIHNTHYYNQSWASPQVSPQLRTSKKSCGHADFGSLNCGPF